jgi:hypothetical protein
VENVDSAVAAGRFTKNMFDKAQTYVAAHLEGTIFEEFLQSAAFEAFVRAAYHVRVDGTPLSIEEEQEEAGATAKSRGGGASKDAGRKSRK